MKRTTDKPTLAKAIADAGQAALDWYDDTGDCHFCCPKSWHGHVIHEEYCPLEPVYRVRT